MEKKAPTLGVGAFRRKPPSAGFATPKSLNGVAAAVSVAAFVVLAAFVAYLFHRRRSRTSGARWRRGKGASPPMHPTVDVEMIVDDVRRSSRTGPGRYLPWPLILIPGFQQRSALSFNNTHGSLFGIALGGLWNKAAPQTMESAADDLAEAAAYDYGLPSGTGPKFHATTASGKSLAMVIKTATVAAPQEEDDQPLLHQQQLQRHTDGFPQHHEHGQPRRGLESSWQPQPELLAGAGGGRGSSSTALLAGGTAGSRGRRHGRSCSTGDALLAASQSRQWLGPDLVSSAATTSTTTPAATTSNGGVGNLAPRIAISAGSTAVLATPSRLKSRSSMSGGARATPSIPLDAAAFAASMSATGSSSGARGAGDWSHGTAIADHGLTEPAALRFLSPSSSGDMQLGAVAAAVGPGDQPGASSGGMLMAVGAGGSGGNSSSTLGAAGGVAEVSRASSSNALGAGSGSAGMLPGRNGSDVDPAVAWYTRALHRQITAAAAAAQAATGAAPKAHLA
ncbi:hypothetical protein Agub_g6947 [Astrephomene gubernaculifera]|uniref:Uncharacterized protein n=1 Tax=Astrephomene gubernaculifera TaxID=47775 RepID=A0AAD3DPP9_9CHLO|nr:hypothetical protein Agub_g6947 [Astrephomene gubernaculifera]